MSKVNYIEKNKVFFHSLIISRSEVSNLPPQNCLLLLQTSSLISKYAQTLILDEYSMLFQTLSTEKVFLKIPQIVKFKKLSK